ncbi:uncharacterized protein LOC125947516 [Dermacentor silvarum]|uniref:uncharacterized protein LOC125947516 n=1 Tax=Dermacentor silvarum TaxID=543639 RepID=UPI00210174EA|nr:uncharacterized protein LOC125947516 [Dermacentor silvarum]
MGERSAHKRQQRGHRGGARSQGVLAKPAVVPYIPDVHNVSWLVSQNSSEYITVGLAGASMFFDLLMFGGCITKTPQMLDAGCLWHYFDLGADLIVGFVSANYSPPIIVINKTVVVQLPKQPPGPVGPSICAGLALCPDATNVLDAANAVLDDSAAKQLSAAVSSHRATEVASAVNQENPYKILLEPPTVRQFLHFPYVLIRAFVKCQMLGMYGKFVRHYKK